jgi:hypothetical protein
MPSRTKAADRVKNANERWDGWVRPPYWDEGVESAFQAALTSSTVPDPWAMVLRFLSEGYGVGIREYQGSYCATLRDSERADVGKTSQLSGWGEDPHDALLVVDYKHRAQLDCDWDTAEQSSTTRKRR